MSSSLLKQYSGTAEIGGGGTASIDNLHQISHAPSLSCTIQDGSPNKKRSCDEQTSPISNKKAKDIDATNVLQSNNNEALAAEVLMGDTTLPTKDIMCNGAPTYTEQSILHSAVSDTSLQLQSKNDEDGSLLSEEVVSKMDKLTNDIQNQNNRQYIKAGETTDNDIYLIRGTDHLPGNKKYNELIQSKKASYQLSNRSGKSAIALSIINELRSHNPPSRFLRMEFGRFYDVGDEEVRKKIVSILGKGTRKAKAQSDTSNITAISYSDGEEQPQQCSALHDICSIAILSQKQFIRSKPTPEKETKNEISDTKSSSPYVEREVSKFLIEEAKHLSPTSQTVTMSREVSPPSQPKSTAAAVQTNSYVKSQPSVMTSSYKAQADITQTAPKIAIASGETDTLDTETTKKLPVAFGFNLNDNASKELAQEATEKCTNEGMKAGKSLRVSIGEGKMISGVPCVTPKVKTPKKTPKTPAELLSTKPAPNLPNGWLVKLFKRQSGATAGSTDKYFYSPDNEIKFRSMKGCNVFIGILDEPDVDGDEAMALKEYKERGYKF